MSDRPSADRPNPTRTHWLGPRLARVPERIVSLVPSLTEAVFQIGAGDRLVGRTRFCVRPADRVERVEAVGGTKNPRLHRILELNPDVILANKEENTRRRIESLAKRFPVWLTDPQSPGHVPSLWLELGAITGLEEEGQARADELSEALRETKKRCLSLPEESRPGFLYYIWKDPAMAAGHGTYISNLLETVGFRNSLPPDHVRFPRISSEVMRDSRADVHLFSTEPYRFELPKDLDLLAPLAIDEDCQKQGPFFQFRSGLCAALVDAERLSWYPSLTLQGLHYAERLLMDLRQKT